MPAKVCTVIVRIQKQYEVWVRNCKKCSAPVVGLSLKCPRCGSKDVHGARAIKHAFWIVPMGILVVMALLI